MQHQKTSHQAIPSPVQQVSGTDEPSIISMLKTLESSENKSWKNHINKLVHA